jgi:tetratricopeptide (TPR) repeat protein
VKLKRTLRMNHQTLAPFPADVNALLALYNARRYAEAESGARALLEKFPEFAFGWKLLGGVLQSQGKDALTTFKKVTELTPADPEAHYNLGVVLKGAGRLEEAAASYRKAIALKPGYVQAHTDLGITLHKSGQLDEASACFRNALEIDPECIKALLGASYLFAISGEIKKVEEHIQKLLKIDPSHTEARLLLASVKKAQPDDENLAALVALANSEQNSERSIYLHFQLGKCFDDIGNYDKAFSHFMSGCKLKRATFKYDSKKSTQAIDEIIEVFNQTTIERLQDGGISSDLPIFVLGMPRSGTTLTEQIIASHPEVHGAGELPDLNKIVQRYVAESGNDFPNNILALNQTDLDAWATNYVSGLQRRDPYARRITDKTPTNFYFLGLLHLMLPNAKIIHVNRNPMDNCLSCFTQFFSQGQLFSYDLSELGRYYVDYSRLMAHWRSVLPPGAFLDVQYEDVVADLETEARRIIDFCGLDWNDACVDFHKHKRPIKTASMTQVRQPIYKSSVERWRAYEKFLDPLLGALGELAGKRN